VSPAPGSGLIRHGWRTSVARAGGRVLAVVAALAAGLALSLWLGGRRSVGGPSRPASGVGGASVRCRRVICMSPAVTEIVFKLGAGSRVVGVSQHTKWPPEALTRPRCGGYFNPNYERILALRPDLIITQGEAEDMRRFARDNGIELFSLQITDLESIFGAIQGAGRVLQLTDAARAVCAELRGKLEAVRQRVSGLPRVRALLVVSREREALNDIYVCGSGTFLDDVIRIAGGSNVAGDLVSSYGVISKEALLAREPEVIVELRGEGASDPAEQQRIRALWQGLAPLPAVREGRVYVLEATYAMIPGPRVVQLAEKLAELFHGRG